MGRVIAVSIWKPSAIPGSGVTLPKPVILPSPTQPDQVATAAGRASRNSGQRGRVFPRTVSSVRSGVLMVDLDIDADLGLCGGGRAQALDGGDGEQLA